MKMVEFNPASGGTSHLRLLILTAQQAPAAKYTGGPDAILKPPLNAIHAATAVALKTGTFPVPVETRAYFGRAEKRNDPGTL